MITLYQREGCEWCRPVRQLLTDLGVSYLNVNVPKPRDERIELIAATGSKFIPALVDDEVVISGRLEDNSAVLEFIRRRWGEPASASVPREPTEDSCSTAS